MGIIKNVLQKQIQDNNRTSFTTSTATILEYDKTTNTAEITYYNPNGDGEYYRANVSISESLGGLTSSGISPGDICSISFINNNEYSPVITGILKNNYFEKTNTDQGAYLVEELIKDIKIPESVYPMYSDWIDVGNTNKSKYINEDFIDYSEYDASKELHNIVTSLDKYSDNEQGITNLTTKSNIKLKENGDIDIFVANNVGIRISKSNHKIYFYGLDIYFNDKQFKSCECLCYNENNINEKNIIDVIKNMKNIEKLISLIDADVEELKLCISYLKTINGMAWKYANLEEQIAQYESIREEYLEKDIDNMEEISKINTQISKFRNTFSTELYDAQVVVKSLQ